MRPSFGSTLEVQRGHVNCCGWVHANRFVVGQLWSLAEQSGWGQGGLYERVASLAEDRTHGASTLAREALRVLSAMPKDDWPTAAAQLIGIRPSMPVVAAAVRLALQTGAPEAVLAQMDIDRRRVAERAAEMLGGHTSGATISNSSTVADALKLAALPSIKVVVAGPLDEGHAMVTLLAAAGLSAAAVPLDHADADIGLVGCDAVFTDGSFVNRRGTAELVKRLMPHLVLVLAEPLKQLDHAAPKGWSEPDLFEIVRPSANVQILQ